MGRVDAITMRALNFGLDVDKDLGQAAAALVVSAGQDGRLLRKVAAARTIRPPRIALCRSCIWPCPHPTSPPSGSSMWL
jgi:hypothetical protein